MQEIIDTNFKSRIEILVKKAGGQNAFSRSCGLSLGAIQRYLRGGEPTRPAIIAMSKSSGVTSQWLISGEVEKTDDQVNDGQAFSVYGFAESKQEGWYDEVPWQVSSSLEWPDPDMFAVVAIGYGMKPEGIHPGHLCICSPCSTPLKNDAIYIKKTDGTSSIKKYDRQDSEWLYISGYFEPDGDEKQIKYAEQLSKKAIKQIAPVIFIKRRI